ncbi:MAG: hypothetical protein OER82_09355 [Nitrosopumilus sp.]|nr:hypothetical protein [Nitrosopumilus sp.]
MVFEKGVHNLKKYVENEEKECKKIDEQLAKNGINEILQIRCNKQSLIKGLQISVLSDILQELETDELKLQITFSGPKATDLPNLTMHPLHEKGIKAEYKGGLIRESVEAPQLEYVAFWIGTTITITSGAITIGDFIYRQLKKLKNFNT